MLSLEEHWIDLEKNAFDHEQQEQHSTNRELE
jgi:hypothetical protein